MYQTCWNDVARRSRNCLRLPVTDVEAPRGVPYPRIGHLKFFQMFAQDGGNFSISFLLESIVNIHCSIGDDLKSAGVNQIEEIRDWNQQLNNAIVARESLGKKEMDLKDLVDITILGKCKTTWFKFNHKICIGELSKQRVYTNGDYWIQCWHIQYIQ